MCTRARPFQRAVKCSSRPCGSRVTMLKSWFHAFDQFYRDVGQFYRDRWKFSYIEAFAPTDDAAPALVEWTWRRGLHCRIWDKHAVSSGLSTTVVWFSSRKSGRWQRKVTEHPSLLCEWRLRAAKFSFTYNVVQTPPASMWLAALDQPVAFMYNAVQTPLASMW